LYEHPPAYLTDLYSAAVPFDPICIFHPKNIHHVTIRIGITIERYFDQLRIPGF
jgi:hypothetical protein